MNAAAAKPRLSRKVRLRFDRKTGRHLLLYPEVGLELSRTAADVARLCTGERTVEDICRQLLPSYAGASARDVERDVRSFLEALAGRGLLEGLP